MFRQNAKRTGRAPSVETPTVAPVITAQPSSQTIIAGNSATFSVTATGTWPLTYQWKHNGQVINGQVIAGATSASYTISNVTASDAGSYTVVVSNEAGSVASEAAVLTVNAVATLSISSESGSFGSGAGSGEVAVSASGGAEWTAKSDSSWITVTGGTGGIDSFETPVSYTHLTLPTKA